MNADSAMERIHKILCNAWMVRNFLKHAEEIQDDEDLLEVPRMIFDSIRAVEGSYLRRDASDFLRRIRGKLPKLRGVAEVFAREQPRVSTHTNFQMAVVSLNACIEAIAAILQEVDAKTASEPKP